MMGKRINQNQIPVKEAGKSNVRSPFLSKLAQIHYTKAGAAILAIIVLHFVSNFIFFRGESLQSEQTSVKTENKQTAEIKKEYETSDSSVKTTPASVAPVVQPEPESKSAPARRVTKKKEPRETTAGRLRRAEKILTGI